MSKGKNFYKQFSLDSIDKGLLALGSLISYVTINLIKYKEYFSELEGLLDKYCMQLENSTREIYIPAKEYDDINDKLLFRQRELIKFTADESNDSFSYLNLRKRLVKFKYLQRPLDTEVSQMLNTLLKIRNWSFHNPQSSLVAAYECATKGVPKDLSDFAKIESQLNPVIINITTQYELSMLFTLMIHVESMINQFELILKNMKIDYSEMYEKTEFKQFHFKNGRLTQEVIYLENPRICRLNDMSTDVIQLSMAIQKSEYDGSDESFEKLVMKKPRQKNDG